MKEMRVLMQIVKTISGIVAIVTFISGVLVLIDGFLYNSLGTGLIAEYGRVKIYGLLGSEDYSAEIVKKMRIVLVFFCFLEAVAAISVKVCLGKVLEDVIIFTMENVKITRNVGIFIMVVFAVFRMTLSAIAIYNKLSVNHEYVEMFMKKIYSISTVTLVTGIIFILLSVFLKAGYEARSMKI